LHLAGNDDLGVLFITNDASRTGAPRLLLHLAQELLDVGGVRMCFLVRRGGPLLREFAKLGPTVCLSEYSVVRRIMGRDLFRRRAVELLARSLARRVDGIDLIYSNTAANGQLLGDLEILHRPTISHIHELGHVIVHGSLPMHVATMTRVTDQFIAASRACKQSLINDFGVLEARVRVIHEFIPLEVNTRCSSLRNELAIPSDALLIGAAGSPATRKSPDVFLQVARQVRQSRRGIDRFRFVWVGGDGAELDFLRRDIALTGLNDYVYAVGDRGDAPGCFADFDLFLLPSREDTYPLVVLECAAQSIPTICFAAAGGAPEFVEQDAGRVVPYLNVEAMTAAVLELGSNAAQLGRLGERAKSKVSERHNVRDVVPEILGLMQGTAFASCSR
jgi:glycosyltransferase involved in cell wall biosynthesis